MNEEYKCKDCKWLTGKKNIRGIECMNPKNQEKWNKAKTLWMGELRKDSARYKQGSALACKKFEAKESEHMGRYIDADALIEDMQERYCKSCKEKGEDYNEVRCRACMVGDAIDDVDGFADNSIDIEPKRGEWIDMGDFEQCSVCKGTHLKEFQSYYGKTTWIKTPYCPNCGADMRGVGDES